MKSTLLIITSFFLIELVPLSSLFLSKGNLQSVSKTKNTVHTSNNCEVFSFDVNNSNYVDGKIYCIKIYKNRMNFEVTKNPSDFDFSINSNFFASRPLGEVIIGKKLINKRAKGGGFFSSKDGNFDVTTGNRPSNVEYSSQTHLVGIRNGELNSNVLNAGWSKAQYYRILVGKDSYGNLIILHSNRFALVSIKDICKVGKSVGMTTGLIFDGGASVDVSITDGLYSHSFQALPTIARKFKKNVTPLIYIAGNFK
jgi:hypothetical protein